MPTGRFKSRSYRRVFKKLPGGRVTLHYERRKPQHAQCGSCGSVLSGVPRVLPYQMQKLAKTARRPERPFGGVLCSRCMRERIKGTIQ
ncbi:50S ribosomal protein L34e [Candidatus Woesearchaeota archaeon]|nr:50S ribosomal protein L34e [Candidatus Woesearchaeota archaeon]